MAVATRLVERTQVAQTAFGQIADWGSNNPASHLRVGLRRTLEREDPQGKPLTFQLQDLIEDESLRRTRKHFHHVAYLWPRGAAHHETVCSLRPFLVCSALVNNPKRWPAARRAPSNSSAALARCLI